MPTVDPNISKLELLLSEDRLDEARPLIVEIASVTLSAKEQAGTFISVASAYLDIANSINRQYKDALEQAIAGIEKISRIEGNAPDTARIAELKESLKK